MITGIGDRPTVDDDEIVTNLTTIHVRAKERQGRRWCQWREVYVDVDVVSGEQKFRVKVREGRGVAHENGEVEEAHDEWVAHGKTIDKAIDLAFRKLPSDWRVTPEMTFPSVRLAQIMATCSIDGFSTNLTPIARDESEVTRTIDNMSPEEFMGAMSQWASDEQFSWIGLIAIYEYLSNRSFYSGEPIEFDGLGICCSFREYHSIDELADDIGRTFQSEEELRRYVEQRARIVLWSVDDGKGHIVLHVGRGVGRQGVLWWQ